MSVLAACGGLAYLHAKQEQAAEGTVDSSKPRRTSEVATANTSTPAITNGVVASTDVATSGNTSGTSSNQSAATPQTIAQWVNDTESTNPKTRAAAIAALANAPKAVAMPVLKRVLEVGERDVDRNVALNSMYSIALRDGDSTGEVRDAMRHAIYHGDDDGVTQNAQSLLDDIEAEFAQRRKDAKANRTAADAQ